MTTTTSHLVLLLALSGLALAGEAAPAQVPPLGHPDFYPSAERPIGWRGDRSGAFPGATPVLTWDSKQNKNIVWKCRMPTPSWSQPIVVGDKVFTCADPNLLICVSARDGKILWQKEVDHTSKMPPEQAKKVKEEVAAINKLFPLYADSVKKLAKVRGMAKAKGINDDDLRKMILKPMWMVAKEDFTSPAWDKALADPELKPLVEELAQVRRDYSFAFNDPHRGDNWSAFSDYRYGGDEPTPYLKALNDRMDALIRDASIWTWPRQNWYNCTTMTFATPCSDGKAVYVAFASNQIAAYDLNGKELWMTWDHPVKERQNGVLHTRFVPSPVLAGDYLVVNQNDEIRAFDKKTGRKIWGIWAPNHKKPKTDNRIRSHRPEPEGKSPVHMRLPLAGTFVDVIACCGGNIYRVSDGKILGKGVPGLDKGQSPVAQGDLLVWKTGSDSGKYPIGVCRLVAKSADEVVCERLWTDEGSRSGETTAMISNGMAVNDNGVWDAISGKRLASIKLHPSWNSPILIGDYIIGSRGVHVVSWKQPDKITTNVLEDDIRTLDPEWDRRVYCGMAETFGNGSFYAAGNRLFFRTAGHLWCIGDPAQAWRSPAGAPAEALVK